MDVEEVGVGVGGGWGGGREEGGGEMYVNPSGETEDLPLSSWAVNGLPATCIRELIPPTAHCMIARGHTELSWTSDLFLYLSTPQRD